MILCTVILGGGSKVKIAVSIHKSSCILLQTAFIARFWVVAVFADKIFVISVKKGSEVAYS